MNRKEFLRYGSIITVGAFIAGSTGASAMTAFTEGEYSTNASGKRPDPGDFDQPILKAIALGINAPSAHNTQSWKFKVINDLEMELYVDENMLLPATDPPSRQIHMGAGCFIETMVMGASRYGYSAEVSYFPEGYANEADFGVKPVARVALNQTGIDKDPLADFIEARQTSRMKYKGSLLSQRDYDKLVKQAGKSYSTLTFINKGMAPYLDIFYRAMEIESRTYATNEETREMFRFSEEERKAKGDGISIPQMGYKGMIERIAEKSLKNGDHDTWHSEKNIKNTMKGIKKGLDTTKGIVIWHTATNDFKDWVLSGRDYVRFSHAATKNGYFLHPYNQAIQEYKEMDGVRKELDALLNIKSPQKIQMLVRIGKSDTPYLSYRRTLDSYLTK
ncbi:hypothetical protein [Phaeodactylibacter sp.]|uniref:Acg family FMN-binding oxidoreductase n=1 Tax=Phaeodactylibacter sp. TaxID=1940289 RepID=UPI0025CE490D|nr:hypothetical protein [Phaeodactylibacter sp.]MCI4647228.1 hypothetical protein [Phaeodactylibacter sp.]MCI5093953.1 hypothetical protein [Phaeodactylibacter sp.]